MKLRPIPKSIERQSQPHTDKVQAWASLQVQKSYEEEPELPEDMPTVQDWFRIRIWTDEIEGRSLTL